MPHAQGSSPAAVKDEPVDDASITSSIPQNDDDDVNMLDASHAAADDAAVKKTDSKLDDLFAHDDDSEDDDEFPSSAPVKAEAPSSQPQRPPSPTKLTSVGRDRDLSALRASDPEVMRSFYQRLFPWRQLFQWLNHSPTPTSDFGNREFAFTLQNDAYLRYQSFATADLLRKDVLRLMPSRFEIGPVYTTNPRDRKTLRNSSAFKPLAKELCFDIDLTDYDDIRTCCDKANICTKCWAFMTMAVKVVDVALRDDFGFKHILWVYSGRRGAHAWVCDKKARAMDDQKRKAVAGYLEVIRGGAQSGKKVNLWRPLHPHIIRSLDLLKTHFQEDVLAVQDPWSTDENAEKLLQLLPDRALNEALRRKWQAAPGRASASKWADIDAVAKAGHTGLRNLDTRALMEAKQDVVLEYTYPRLDIEVSKKLNHLLKSPFVVHPGTGRVCVPIDTTSAGGEALERFNPLAVPTVQGLLAEIDAWKGGNDGEDGGSGVQDWEKTSLKPYVEYFRSFVAGVMRDERDARVKREREDDSMEF
ncbi:DNA primase small subunit [Cordyceps fumosorosea ARSEF 2679]|uniref:DNA primase n=1 Tax=Cordyceps fumosorosea (strain ARSEF 2679) TaxID=1081104 RepID=A0A168EBW3_CORFA|nr:DNA primase small subunit [Cordyceps fumosorosea ARSEF 2679]OAA73626.1 DNA primase small subunit [Cordyceps fumosorosea ARSEF 2679]